jgi:hypothetical protein
MSSAASGRYRSRSDASARWRVFGDRLAAVTRSAVCYQLLIVIGLILLQYGVWFDAEVREKAITRADSAAILGLAFAILVCVSIGQILTVLRLREWLLVGACVVWYGFLGGMKAEAGDLRGNGAPEMALAILTYLGPLFVLCGSWSLRTGRALLAVWLPLMLTTGGGVLVAQASEKIPTWEDGDKWQVWEPISFFGLVVEVLLIFLFLASRERQSLKIWEHGDGAHIHSPSKERAPAPRLSALGWLLIGAIGFGLAAGTASTAPFLWELDSADEGYGSQQGEPKRKPDYEDSDDRGELNPDETPSLGGGGGGAPPPPQPVPYSHSPPWFLLLLLLTLLLLALLLGYRPVKRLLTLQHLRKPFWHVDATGRVEQSWRLVEVALCDAGMRPRPGEPAGRMLKRAQPLLDQFSASGAQIGRLAEAAAIRDRVAYGLGIGPDDERVMVQVSSWAHDSIWERLGDFTQLRAMYRSLDAGGSIGEDGSDWAHVDERNIFFNVVLSVLTLGLWLILWHLRVRQDVSRLGSGRERDLSDEGLLGVTIKDARREHGAIQMAQDLNIGRERVGLEPHVDLSSRARWAFPWWWQSQLNIIARSQRDGR